MLVFVFSRALFYVFQWNECATLSVGEIMGSFWYGARMDASFAGYISLATSLIILLFACFSSLWTRRVLVALTAILLFSHALLTVADAELFKAWGFRLDTTPFAYLKNPGEALASTPILQIILLSILTFALFVAWAWVFLKTVARFLPKEGRAIWWNAPLFLLFGGLCIIPMRGGFDTSTMNQGSVFFSDKSLANQGALNMPWNLMYAITNRDMFKEYKFMSDEEAKNLSDEFLNVSECLPIDVLNTNRPNVIVILMESFSVAKIGKMGEEKGITPCFDALIDEGLLFANVYADGYRTERGLVATLSGYPSQTTKSVIRDNSRLNQIPMLPAEFRNLGYSTAFYYGGDISFVNTRGYVLSAGFQRYTDKSDYPEKPHFSWGVHDEAIFEKMLNDLDTVTTPFFYSALTLSNHEPHTVPIPAISESDKWANSTHYADKCLGDFIEQAKTKSWWDSTLIILVADHGVRYNLPNYDERAFHIPLLWLGGALKAKNVRVDNLGNQRDIAATLLSRLEISTAHYKFSKDLLNPNAPNFVLYTFVDGFGFLKDSAFIVYDNASSSILQQRNANDTILHQGQALFQMMNDDFLELGRNSK